MGSPAKPTPAKPSELRDPRVSHRQLPELVACPTACKKLVVRKLGTHAKRVLLLFCFSLFPTPSKKTLPLKKHPNGKDDGMQAFWCMEHALQKLRGHRAAAGCSAIQAFDQGIHRNQGSCRPKVCCLVSPAVPQLIVLLLLPIPHYELRPVLKGI